MRVLRFASAMLLLSAPVFAQDEVARKQAVEIASRERVPLEKAMKGAPYSAETVVESTQTLADGNRINRKTTGQVYRDSEGRTRREEDVTVTAKTPTGLVSTVRKTISIVDPVAGLSYSLDPESKIAWQTTMGGGVMAGKLAESVADINKKIEMEKMVAEKMTAARKAGAGDEQSRTAAEEEKMKAAAAAGGARGRAGGGGAAPTAAGAGGRGTFGGRGYAMAAEAPLEHKTLEGVAVEGRKTTTVIPAGQIGNEQPITITSEEWRSLELNLLVLTKHSDPRTGESSYRLQNIIRAEPDRSLFMVPPDYTVRETGIRKMMEQELSRKR
jgi:hypothetical protein